jgi:hypothetical protein
MKRVTQVNLRTVSDALREEVRRTRDGGKIVNVPTVIMVLLEPGLSLHDLGSRTAAAPIPCQRIRPCGRAKPVD